MNKNVIMVKISGGGGYSLTNDFHPPPACRQRRFEAFM